MLEPRDIAKIMSGESLIPEGNSNDEGSGGNRKRFKNPLPKSKKSDMPKCECGRQLNINGECAKCDYEPSSESFDARIKAVFETDNANINSVAAMLTDDPIVFNDLEEAKTKNGAHLLSGKGTDFDELKVDGKFDNKAKHNTPTEKDNPGKSKEAKVDPGEGGTGAKKAGNAKSAAKQLEKVSGVKEMKKKSKPGEMTDPGEIDTGSQKYVKNESVQRGGVIGFKSPDIVSLIAGAPSDNQLKELEESLNDDEIAAEYGIDSGSLSSPGRIAAIRGTEGHDVEPLDDDFRSGMAIEPKPNAYVGLDDEARNFLKMIDPQLKALDRVEHGGTPFDRMPTHDALNLKHKVDVDSIPDMPSDEEIYDPYAMIDDEELGFGEGTDTNNPVISEMPAEPVLGPKLSVEQIKKAKDMYGPDIPMTQIKWLVDNGMLGGSEAATPAAHDAMAMTVTGNRRPNRLDRIRDLNMDADTRATAGIGSLPLESASDADLTQLEKSLLEGLED